jgi:S-methylmethionine-dependent homocysteine/selenocysteine methylase
MKSLLLDRDAWDLVLDANGNIAACWEPYARAHLEQKEFRLRYERQHHSYFRALRLRAG